MHDLLLKSTLKLNFCDTLKDFCTVRVIIFVYLFRFLKGPKEFTVT